MSNNPNSSESGSTSSETEVEDTGFVQCPICEETVKAKGQYVHFRNNHSDEDYDEWKGRFQPTAPPEGYREAQESMRGKKKEEEKEVEEPKEKPKNWKEDMLQEVEDYMREYLPMIPEFTNRKNETG